MGVLLSDIGAASAEDCPGNPDALGTARVMSVDSTTEPAIGVVDYAQSLPLQDHEIVLTFDDGPIAPYTNRVLDALKFECVKATFFVVGQMARARPELVRRAHAEGHTIGTHTQTHPHLRRLAFKQAEANIRQGIASAASALGAPDLVAPFFRAPYLELTERLRHTLLSQGIMLWSTDIYPGDWNKISPEVVVTRTMERLGRRGRGIILLHDIHQRTAAALPPLLRELKHSGFHIVHIVPGRPGHGLPSETPKQL